MIELNILMQKHIRNKRVIEPEKNFSFKEQKLKDGCEVISFKKKKNTHQVVGCKEGSFCRRHNETILSYSKPTNQSTFRILGTMFY